MAINQLCYTWRLCHCRICKAGLRTRPDQQRLSQEDRMVGNDATFKVAFMHPHTRYYSKTKVYRESQGGRKGERKRGRQGRREGGRGRQGKRGGRGEGGEG